jgi:hypothetical protein
MTIEMIGCDVDPAKIIAQEGRTCVPTSLLNALRFGPSSFQEIFMALPGGSDSEKLRSLVELRGSEPSEVVRGRKLFESGVQMDDIAAFFNSLLAASGEFVTGKHFDVASQEKPAAHLRRIYSLLISSLQQRVPVVAMVRAFAAAEREGEEFRWRGLGQHAVLIVRVPASITPDAQGFVCQFVDPAIGALCEGYVYSEISREFHAMKTSSVGFTYSEAENKFVPLKGLGDRWIKNGFLHLVSSSLWLGTQDVPWYARTFVTLSHGVGNFNGRDARNSKGHLWVS